MTKRPPSKKKAETEKEFKNHQKDFANLLKESRIALGFKTPEHFSNIVGITKSQYADYESGSANPTLFTIIKLLLLFGINPNTVIKFRAESALDTSETIIEKLISTKSEQLREQVALLKGRQFSYSITQNTYYRIYKTLAFCVVPRSKEEILKNIGLSNTTNNFQRAIGLALELVWLEMTNPESPNSPRQRYVITEEGKKVV
tara:strand:+ start:370 stop:975 length:606 start_codon:yes stop_codon:yes gene_type:complete